MYDVHVVGAGPAGSFAAYTAATQGNKVLLSEEHASVGAPVACSGLISKSGLDEMSDLVNYKKISINTIDGAIVYAGGQRFDIKAEGGEKAHLIDRQAFDTLACEAAQLEGAKLVLSDHVTAKNTMSNCIIGADGPNSAMAAGFGFPKIRNFVITMQADFEMDVEDRKKVAAYLDNEAFPGFFGWVIPKGDGSAKVGLGAKLPCDIRKKFSDFQKRLGITNAKNENPVSAIIPVKMRKITGMEKNGKKIILCGDAAGQVKATTGGGIYFGASCGRLAGLHFNDPAKYQSEWVSQYGYDLGMHGWIYGAMHGFNGAHHSSTSQLLKIIGAESFLARFGEMDRITKTFHMTNFLKFVRSQEIQQEFLETCAKHK